jgi:hypothetical protein
LSFDIRSSGLGFIAVEEWLDLSHRGQTLETQKSAIRLHQYDADAVLDLNSKTQSEEFFRFAIQMVSRFVPKAVKYSLTAVARLGNSCYYRWLQILGGRSSSSLRDIPHALASNFFKAVEPAVRTIDGELFPLFRRGG